MTSVEIPPGLTRAARLEAVLARDGATCVWCGRALWLGHRDLSVEHVIPKLKGGPAWAENEVVACRSCNRARGHTSPAQWLETCEGRGLRADRARVEASLLCLRRAIDQRGGRRKARPYLDGQLRRLRLVAA